ncbi:hypothetical protein JHN52_28250, partial [Streptomyces sp. MBT97]|nr:hypothetical protein [Streptomyces sp. MBT97]
RVERGALHRTVAYGSHGCAAFYAVGENALMVVLGDEGMDVERLHTASQPALRRIDLILTGRTDRADRIGWSETTVKTAEGV